MSFMWFLIGIVLVAVVCTAREIVRGWRYGSPKYVVPLPVSCSRSIDSVHPTPIRKRQVKWISIRECESLVLSSNEIAFIALRPAGAEVPLPFPGLHAFTIAPSQLADVLRWLPPSCSCVVLCGEVDSCPSILGSLDNTVSFPPVYVLKTAAAHSKAG
jgi:hypothetical protein